MVWEGYSYVFLEKYINSNWNYDEIYKISKAGKDVAKFGNIGTSGTIKPSNKLKLCAFQRYVIVLGSHIKWHQCSSHMITVMLVYLMPWDSNKDEITDVSGWIRTHVMNSYASLCLRKGHSVNVYHNIKD
jgi:hypothetical protein